MFFGLIENTRRSPGFWFVETFSTSFLKPLNRIQWNLTGSWMSSTMFVLFGPIGNPWWPFRPLICWEMFDFSSERNSMTLDRKQDPNVLYLADVFRADLAPDCWGIFDFSSETADRNSTKLYRKQDLNVLYHVCIFHADQKNKRPAQASDWLSLFDFCSETTERSSTKLKLEQYLNVLYQVCVFRNDAKTKITAWPVID